MVGRVWPRYWHRGRPLNSVVRRHRRSAVPAFIVLYRWKLKSGAEHAFVDAWSRITARLRMSGESLGSRLHHGSDDIWYGYAQWPNEEARRTAFEGLIDHDLATKMKSAIAESMPEVVLECIADQLVPLGAA
jgi:hypothetical protein